MKKLCLFLFSSILLLSPPVFSQPEIDNVGNISKLPMEEVHEGFDVPSLRAFEADWTFSGIVVNENGERYQYFVEIQRQESKLLAFAALINGSTKELVLYEETQGNYDPNDPNSMRAGKIFLRFNPINNSWIFGVKNKEHKGFNFKVDMLGLNGAPLPKQQKLRADLDFLMMQTSHLNGHLQTGENNKEQFVTAPKAWFRQIWAIKSQTDTHPLLGVICQFNDGSGFYSMNMKEPDALRASVAGWRNEQGEPVSMSQFITIKMEKEGSWLIEIPSPKLSFALEDMLFSQTGKHQLVAGLIKGGFCVISQNETSLNKQSNIIPI